MLGKDIIGNHGFAFHFDQDWKNLKLNFDIMKKNCYFFIIFTFLDKIILIICSVRCHYDNYQSDSVKCFDEGVEKSVAELVKDTDQYFFWYNVMSSLLFIVTNDYC